MELIQSLQKLVPWAAQLPLAPKIVLSVILIAINILLLMLIWSKPKEVTVPLAGNVDVLIWNPQIDARRGLSLNAEEALPVRHGDQIRVEAVVNQPSYLYIIWIGTDGVVHPVYPWKPGRWDTRPVRETPVTRVSLPEILGKGWPIGGAAGMETLVLLARKEPFPKDVDLKELFSGFPEQSFQDVRAVVWLEDGKTSKDLERAPQFFEPQKINDPVMEAQMLIQERLKPFFQLIRAVSFANQGE